MRLSPVFRPPVTVSRLAVPFVVAIGLLSSVPDLGRALAADEPKAAVAADPGDKAAKPARDPAHPVRPIGHEFMTALALWCTVLVIGLGLLAMIVVWGRSVRTLARRKPIPPTAPDPLWYLKTKPPAPAGSAPIDTSQRTDDSDPGSENSSPNPP
jgi:hypothetical protein